VYLDEPRDGLASAVAAFWATLTVNAPASKLRKELIYFFQKLENDDDSRL